MFSLRSAALILLLCAVAVSSGGQTPGAAIVKRAKQATAYMEWQRSSAGGGDGSATAFCIDAQGYFVTSSRAIQRIGPSNLRLVIEPGEVNQQIVAAAVVASDVKSDLGLVKAIDPGRYIPLELGDTSDLLETNAIMALGYPFGKILSTEKGTYPKVTVSTGRITSLRKVDGVLGYIQIDASLNDGNWGGPMLNSQGKVIGVLDMGVDAVSLNFALPVEKLKALLALPSKVTATFTPVAVPFNQRSMPLDWTVQLIAWKRSVSGFDVQLTLPGAKTPRTLKLKQDKADTYKVTAPLIAADAGASQSTTPAQFPFSLQIKKDAVLLKTSGNIVLTHAPTPAATPPRISKAASPPVLTPPMLAADLVKISLGGSADDVTIAGDGRYLVFDLRALQQVAILDVTVGRIVKSLDVADPNRKVVGGRDALFVLTPATKEIARWDLRSMQRTRTVKIGADRTPTSIAMGYASNGPVVVTTNRGFLFYDAETLGLINMPIREAKRNDMGGWSGIQPLHVWASADGTAFVSIPSGVISSPLHLLELEGASGVVKTANLNLLAPPMLPSYDGALLLSGRGLRSLKDTNLPEQLVDIQLLPAVASSLLVGRRRESAAFGRAQYSQTGPPDLHVFSDRGTDPLWTITGLDELTPLNTREGRGVGFATGTATPQRSGRSGGTTNQQRGGAPTPAQQPGGFTGLNADSNLAMHVYLIPAADLLVTLSSARDMVVLRRVRMSDALEKTGKTYLFVVNPAPRDAQKNSAYRYVIDARSASGGLTYKLESGPPGMTVDLDGIVTWNVPISAPPRSSVIVSIQDRAGQEPFHPFSVDTR